MTGVVRSGDPGHPAMRELVNQPLLSAGGTAWTYGDALLLGLLTGVWSLFERDVTEGLALEASGVEAPEDDVRAAIVAFRRERRLLAAEDLRVWMGERGLDGQAVQDCLRRAVLRAGAGRQAARDAVASFPVAASRLAGALPAEAFVSGTLRRCGESLADRAVALAAGEPQPADPRLVDPRLVDALERAAGAGLDRGFGQDLHDRAALVVGADAAYRAFLDRAAGEERIVARLRDRRLDLTKVRFDEVRFGNVDAAREAWQCLRADGMCLPQVAARAGVECIAQEAEIGDLARTLRPGMIAGRPGELVGPLQVDDEWQLAVVHDRRTPTLADREIRRRLTEEVAARALARQAAGRVHWHGHV